MEATVWLDVLSPRPAGEAAVKAHGQHARTPLRPFAVQAVEGVAQVDEELLAVGEAAIGEAHVVGVERVGHDELRLALDQGPVGQVVVLPARVPAELLRRAGERRGIQPALAVRDEHAEGVILDDAGEVFGARDREMVGDVHAPKNTSRDGARHARMRSPPTAGPGRAA